MKVASPFAFALDPTTVLPLSSTSSGRVRQRRTAVNDAQASRYKSTGILTRGRSGSSRTLFAKVCRVAAVGMSPL